jgi:hypothetical protein
MPSALTIPLIIHVQPEHFPSPVELVIPALMAGLILDELA